MSRRFDDLFDEEDGHVDVDRFVDELEMEESMTNLGVNVYMGRSFKFNYLDPEDIVEDEEE